MFVSVSIEHVHLEWGRLVNVTIVWRQHNSNDHLNCYFMLSKVCEFLLLIGVEWNVVKGLQNWCIFNEN